MLPSTKLSPAARRALASAALAVATSGAALAAPSIASLSASALARSGRLTIEGSGFGPPLAGSVKVGGIDAIVSSWSDTTIRAYVPEAAGPGTVDVQVVNESGTSGLVPLEVRLRVPDGRLRWRFEVDARGVRNRPGEAADGTIYVQDSSGTLYALSADGGLRWLRRLGDEGNEGPVVVGADGTIYAPVNPLGPDTQIVALAPDGGELWRFTSTGGQGIIAGPGLGPDGNLYAVTDIGGLGAFSLSPTGVLRWSDIGDPPIAEHGQLGELIAFAADRFFVAFDSWGQFAISQLYAFGLDGQQLFATGRPDDPAQPVVTPQGTVVLQGWSAGAGRGLVAFDLDGTPLWSALATQTNRLSAPDVGPDGSLFVVRNNQELRSLRADGSDCWTTSGHGSLFGPVVSADGTILVSAGAVGGPGPTFVKGFDAGSGALLWEQPIADENGAAVLPWTRPLYAAGGSAVLVGAEPLANPETDLHAYLLAIEVGDALVFADGFESGSTARWSQTQQP